MTHFVERPPRAGVLRWATVGVAAYLGWLVVNLVFIAIFPFLLLVGLIDSSNGYRRLRSFFEGFLRGFFFGYARWIGLHGFAEKPSPKDVRSNAPCVFAANHRSWADALLALALFPEVRVPVKASYTKVPLLGTAITWMGCVPFDKSSAASVVEGTKVLKAELERGHSLFVFPETTRAPGRRLLGFSDVFFRVALDADVPVVPVILHSDTPFLAPGKGSLLTAHRASWTIRMLPPVQRDRRDRASDLGRSARRALSKELSQLDGGEHDKG